MKANMEYRRMDSDVFRMIGQPAATKCKQDRQLRSSVVEGSAGPLVISQLDGERDAQCFCG
jgi:hypothetical protein